MADRGVVSGGQYSSSIRVLDNGVVMRDFESMVVGRIYHSAHWLELIPDTNQFCLK